MPVVFLQSLLRQRDHRLMETVTQMELLAKDSVELNFVIYAGRFKDTISGMLGFCVLRDAHLNIRINIHPYFMRAFAFPPKHKI